MGGKVGRSSTIFFLLYIYICYVCYVLCYVESNRDNVCGREEEKKKKCAYELFFFKNKNNNNNKSDIEILCQLLSILKLNTNLVHFSHIAHAALKLSF
jgi:hypothetical protein